MKIIQSSLKIPRVSNLMKPYWFIKTNQIFYNKKECKFSPKFPSKIKYDGNKESYSSTKRGLMKSNSTKAVDFFIRRKVIKRNIPFHIKKNYNLKGYLSSKTFNNKKIILRNKFKELNYIKEKKHVLQENQINDETRKEVNQLLFDATPMNNYRNNEISGW